MKTKILIPFCFVFLLLTFCRPARAQGTSFTYQGRLNDGANPASGSYDLRFTIYDSTNLPGAIIAGPLTNAATAVSNGLFTVTLDFGANVFNGASRLLEIAVRPAGPGAFVTLAPRQAITSTPYAITASNLSGTLSATQLTGTLSDARLSGNVSLLGQTIQSSEIANGAVGANQLAAGAVTTAALADGAVTAAKVTMETNWLKAITFLNPTPAAFDNFGWSVAAVGSDRVLVGAIGDDTGAKAAGAAYLFSTDGALLTTFTNPTPAAFDYFGKSVAAVGSDRVLIGADTDNTGAADAGAAYLFSTNGTLLTTFTNPTPADSDFFGISVAAVGSDRVLIRAYRDGTSAAETGAAYLFSTNGTLLTTFTNRTPAAYDHFGISVAAVGSDRVLIGADQDNTGATNAGAAYLFSASGTLLTTFTNPTPANIDNFGVSVAAVGSDRVLIGAYRDDTGAADAGAAYLFSTNGTLLTTFTNPTPADSDSFGFSVAAVGSDRVLIGAYGDGTGAGDAGAAYLFETASYTPGLTAAEVAPNSIASRHISDGAVGTAQLGTGAVTTAALADGAVTAAKVTTETNWVKSVTFLNPTPAYFDNFGWSVAAVGSDRVLIGALWDNTGAEDAGAAYLFSTNGNLLTTFTNPTPAVGDEFGYSVAAVGSDRVLIGAYQDDTGAADAGAAYLFSTNGNLLTTFTNPSPASNDFFAISVAAVGSDRVLIGAHRDDTGAEDAGAAYLFSTNGALLTTFTNPTPAHLDFFGISVAAVGSDRVLIGADNDDTGAEDAGAAYLFSTNGTLLTTFTNPTPAYLGNFGISVAAVGSDRVLIGALPVAGAAYLFSTDGALLTTFTNPSPAEFDVFGISVAAVGSDRVLIGADRNDTGASDAGAAYLFSTNGTLLTTFTNPTPADYDNFGFSVAAVGSDRVLIGARGDGTGAPEAGAAYLFETASYTPGLTAAEVAPNSITARSISDGAVGTAQLADGSVQAADVAAASFGTTFWKANGNAGTTAGTHFLGTTDNQPLEFKVNNTTVQRFLPAPPSPNLIAGYESNSIDSAVSGGVIAGGGSPGQPNRINGDSDYSAIGGGKGNVITMPGGTIAGGDRNEVNGQIATVGGGHFNHVNGSYASIPGGYQNVADGGDYGTVGGGGNNTASGDAATIGGGQFNSANGSYASIPGGYQNAANGGDYGTVGGGGNNTASGDAATIGGGLGNMAGIAATVGGGISNNASSSFATIGGGKDNVASGNYAMVPGGELNVAGSSYSFAAGRRAHANHQGSFVWADSQDADFASTANNQFLIRASEGVGIGTTSPVSTLEVVSSKQVSSTSGAGFISAGAMTNSHIAIDSDDIQKYNNAATPGKLYLNYYGGDVSIGSAGATTTIVGTFNNVSDRSLKEDIRPVEQKAVLARLVQMPVSTWKFKGAAVRRHIGPMAQDFHAAFNDLLDLKSDDTTIAPLDEAGVAFVSIQALAKKVEVGRHREEDRIQKLEAENAELKRTVNELKELVQTMDRKLNGGTE